jgi:uncharacterized protein with ATP-grasp and redox domains
VKTASACFPCFSGQIKRTLQHAGATADQILAITRKAETIIERASLDEVPARTTTVIHRLLRDETGTDPYCRVKEEYNRIALDLLPSVRQRARGFSDRLDGAVRAAIAGNIIDFGIYDTIRLDHSIEESFSLPLDSAAYGAFASAVKQARRILYLCDNAGEIVFDRILVEVLRDAGKDVVAVVKGSAVINDATMDDAVASGLSSSVRVIDNGNDGIGTLLEACSDAFRKEYRSADLIISKGQANYETLVSEANPKIFFLFKVKCPVVAAHLNMPDRAVILKQGGS